MECLIPLSVLSKLQKYGVKPYKPYNDAKKLLAEKYELTIIEDPEMGKSIKIENEGNLLSFLSYLIEELLGRGEVVGQRVTYEGVPFEKYELLQKELLECEKDKTLYWERLQVAEKFTKKLEKEIEMYKGESELLKNEVKALQSEVKRLKEEKRRAEMLRYLEELKKLVLNSALPDAERNKAEDIIKKLEGRCEREI